MNSRLPQNSMPQPIGTLTYVGTENQILELAKAGKYPIQDQGNFIMGTISPELKEKIDYIASTVDKTFHIAQIDESNICLFWFEEEKDILKDYFL